MSWCWPWKIVEKQSSRWRERGKVARVYREDKQETVAWNIFDASSFFAIERQGPSLFDRWASSSFESRIGKRRLRRTVWSMIGNQNLWWEKSLEMVAHPDSDHLNICQVAVGPDKTVQIVAGAPNARVGLKTIVALQVPWCRMVAWFPRALRGEKAMGWCAVRANCTCQMLLKNEALLNWMTQK